MKKTRAFFSALILITGFLSSCNFTAIPNDGSNADNRLSQGYSEPAKDNGGSGGNGMPGLYKVGQGYELAPWDCWDHDGTVAELSAGADGGIRLTAITRNCGGTYFGVNLAAGTESGANADLDGKGFTKIVMKIRGTASIGEVYFFAINAGEGNSIGDGDGTKDDWGNYIWYKLSHYTTEYNETTWTEIEVPITIGNSTNTMSSCLTVGGDKGWLEIKDIDWQDADGNSVIPAYIEQN